MAENIACAFRFDALVEKFETDQLTELGFERPRPLRHRVQQAEGEFAADHRGGLEKLFCLVRQPIDARHHNIMDRVRNHEGRSKVLARVKRKLLEKERVAVSL